MSSPTSKRPRSSSTSAPVEWWIAKLPEFVLQDWDKRTASKPNDPVAKLDLPPDYTPSQLPKRMSLTAPGSASSTELEFLVRPEYLPGSKIQPPTLLVISETGTEKKCALEGRAVVFADVRPTSGTSVPYQQLVDERKSRYESDLQTQKIELEEGSSGISNQFKMLSGVRSSDRGRPARPTFLKRADRAVDKRVRVDETQLKSKLFHLFDEKPYYRLSELVQLTDQPKSYLKEVLDQICVQHRMGQYMHHYSLKPNYRLTTDVEETPAV